MANKILICLMLTLTLSQLCYGSAIPMWEFLSRNEKMSHLYSIFAKLVSDYCKTSYEVRNIPVAQCKRDLLTYASDKLQQMPDTNLDILDPYQRGANDLIWNTIMKEHPNVRPTTKRPQSNGGSASSSSNHIQILNPTTSTLSSDASIIVFGNNQINGYQKNPIFDEIDNTSSSSSSSAATNNNPKNTSSSYAMEMDAAYGNFHHTNKNNNNNNSNNNNNNKKQQQKQPNKETLIGSSGIIASALSSSSQIHPLNNHNHHNHHQNNQNQQIYQISDIEILNEPTSQNYLQLPQQSLIETSTNYLSGPLVIRVRPDGTPVEEDKYKPLPRDDDRDFIVGGGNNPFIRRQKNFILPQSEQFQKSDNIFFYQQQQPLTKGQQQQQQHQQQQQQLQQYQRLQQRLRRQYRNSNSFRTIRRH